MDAKGHILRAMKTPKSTFGTKSEKNTHDISNQETKQL